MNISTILTEHLDFDNEGSYIVVNNRVIYFDTYGVPILFNRPVDDVRYYPVITLTAESKWYSLNVVMPDNRVYQLDLTDILAPDYEKYVDNNYHPRTLKLLALALDCGLDESSLNAATGRWCEEIREDEWCMLSYDEIEHLKPIDVLRKH